MRNTIFFNKAPHLALETENRLIKLKQNLLFCFRKRNRISSYTLSSTIFKLWINKEYFSILRLKTALSRKTLVLRSLRNNNILSYSRYYFVGLGYKVYVFKNYLFIWVGLTHYTLIALPSSIKVFAKKKRIYIIGTSQDTFKIFLNKIRNSKRKDIYKGKGLLEVKSYKNFIRMKTGKKKQY